MAKKGKASSKAGGASVGATGSSGSSGPSAAAPGSGSAQLVWPRFKPTLPVVDLELDTLIPEKVVVLRNFFPRSLCRDFVTFIEELPLAKTPGKPKKGEAARSNHRYQLQDPAFANRLWEETGLKQAVLSQSELWGGEVVGLNSNIRLYKYLAGEYFGPHYDDHNLVDVETASSEHISAKTTWTLLLYLTSTADGSLEGGETSFYLHDRPSSKEELSVAPETGMLLLHKHGDDCLLHEGKEVTAGAKFIIRSDLCVRR